MSDGVTPSDGTEKMRQWAGEIGHHVRHLLAAHPTPQQTHALESIRIASQKLAAALKNQDKHTAVHPTGQGCPPKPSAPRPDAIEVELSLPPLKILLAEDNPFTQKLLTRLLEQNNHQIVRAADGQTVLAAIQKNHFDLILMDIRMPVLDGIETTRILRQREEEQGRPRTPIVAVTGLVDETEKKRILAAGIDGYHSKPIQARELRQEMARIFHRHVKQAKPPTSPPENRAPPPLPDDFGIKKLLETVDNDWFLMQEISTLFFANAPQQIDQMQQAIHQDNAGQLREIAHSLKGAVSAYGENQVYRLSLELEQRGASANLADANNTLESLRKAVANMEQALETTLSENGVKHS